MRLMTPSLPQAFELRFIEVVLQDWLIIRMRTLLDNDASALTWREPAYVSEALLGNDYVKVVFCLVNVRTHGYDTGNTRWVSL